MPAASADARRGVARGGLGDDVSRGQVGKLRCRRVCLVRPRDDQDAIARHQGLDARDRLLNHCLIAGESQKLLGPVASALGPETGTTAAGHDHCVQHRRFPSSPRRSGQAREAFLDPTWFSRALSYRRKIGRSTTIPGSIFDFSSFASRAKSGLISMPNGTEPSGRRGTVAPACSSQLPNWSLMRW